MFSDTREALEKAGVVVVPAGIRSSRRLAEAEPRVEILGDIDNMIAVVSALAVKVVFVEDYKLTLQDFLDEAYRDDDDDDDSQPDEIDLRSLEARLDAFTADINTVVARDVFFFHENRYIAYRKESPRFKEFLALREAVVEAAQEEASKAADSRERARVAHEQEVIREVRALKTDPAFIQKAKTKTIAMRALVAYVRETVDGAGDLENAVLVREVTAIRDSLMLG